MIIRQVLGTAMLFTLMGAEPPAVTAAVPQGSVRFAIVTPNDHPQYIKIAPQRHARHVVARGHSKNKSAAVTGNVANGAASGARAGRRKGAAAGAIAGQGAGFVYRRSPHKKIVPGWI